MTNIIPVPAELLSRAVPDELKELDCWTVWIHERDGKGKPVHVPYTPSGKRASCTDATTHSSFAACLEVYANKKLPGLDAATGCPGPDGYVLAAFDFDDCCDQWGTPSPRVLEILEALGSYAEWSPSKTGIRILCWARVGTRGIGKPSKGFEFFCGNHFASVTGNKYFPVDHSLVRIESDTPQRLCDQFLALPDVPFEHSQPVLRESESAVDRVDDVPRTDDPQRHDVISRDEVEKVVKLLSDERARDYETWIGVLCGLQDAQSRCDVDLSGLWHQFSQRCPDKYDTGECQRRWDDFTYREDDSGRITVASLFHWAHEDGGTFEIREPSVGPTNDETDRDVLGVEQNPLMPYEPFPVHYLPGSVKQWTIESGEAGNIDTAYTALPLLSCLASCIGNSRVTRIKNSWKAPPILWTLLVGESSSGKTIGYLAMLSLLKQAEQDYADRYADDMKSFEAERLRYELAVQQWKKNKGTDEPPFTPSPPTQCRLYANDATVEAMAVLLRDNPRGLLLCRDELSGWIGGFDKYSKGKQSSDLSHWLEMYGGQPMTTDRKSGDHKVVRVPRASVSVSGGIQPMVLRGALVGELMDSGFSARFLMAYPPFRDPVWTDSDVNHSIKARVELLIDKLHGLDPDYDERERPVPVEMRLSADARQAYIAYFDRHAVEMKSMSGVMKSLWGKLEESAIRLAMVIHLAKWAEGEESDPDVISLDSLQRGMGLAEWFGWEGARIYRLFFGSSAFDADMEEVVHYVETKGGSITVRDLSRGPKKYRGNAEGAERALASLVQAGIGEWTFESGKRGPPTRVFTLRTPPHATCL